MLVSCFKGKEADYAQNHNQVHAKPKEKIKNTVGQRKTLSQGAV